MLPQLREIIAREEAFLPRFAPGTSQHSLLKNRIAALETVCNLLTKERTPTREELEFALPRIESILRKMSAACSKYEPGSKNYKRFSPAVQLMEEAKLLLLKHLSSP